jgi:hypothetical protein
MKKKLQKQMDGLFEQTQMKAKQFQNAGGEIGWQARNEPTFERAVARIVDILKHEAGPLWERDANAPKGQPRSAESQVGALEIATPKQIAAINMILEMHNLKQAVENPDFPRDGLAMMALGIGAKLMRIATESNVEGLLMLAGEGFRVVGERVDGVKESVASGMERVEDIVRRHTTAPNKQPRVDNLKAEYDKAENWNAVAEIVLKEVDAECKKPRPNENFSNLIEPTYFKKLRESLKTQTPSSLVKNVANYLTVYVKRHDPAGGLLKTN